MQNIIFPYALKPNRHEANQNANNRRKIREAMWKAKKSTDWYHLDPETIEDIHELYNNDTTRKDVSEALDLRTGVLWIINKGLVPAVYPLKPLKKNEIRPIEKAA